eukprot:806727-Rhodomonas_salina.2
MASMHVSAVGLVCCCAFVHALHVVVSLLLWLGWLSSAPGQADLELVCLGWGAPAVLGISWSPCFKPDIEAAVYEVSIG